MTTPPRPKLLLFVCSGNTCRSPMAEAMARADACLPEGWRVASAGLHCAAGAPASREAISVARENGWDLHGHRSRPMTDALAASASLIVGMTADHVHELRARFPHGAHKVRLFRDYSPWAAGRDIPDPFGGTADDYRACLSVLRESLPGLFAALKSNS